MTGNVLDLDIPADAFGLELPGHPCYLDTPAHGRESLEVIPHRLRHGHFKPDARITIARLRVFDADIHTIGGAQILHLNAVPVSPLLVTANHDGIAIVAGNDHVAGDVADADAAARADRVGVLKILCLRGDPQENSDRDRSGYPG